MASDAAGRRPTTGPVTYASLVVECLTIRAVCRRAGRLVKAPGGESIASIRPQVLRTRTPWPNVRRSMVRPDETPRLLFAILVARFTR